MSIALIPNHIQATVAWLRSLSQVTAICPSRLITAKRSSIPALSWGIVPTMAGGFGAAQGTSMQDFPLNRLRVDLKLFGPTEHDVARLYQVVHPAFIPFDRRSYGFTAEGCQVTHVWHEGGPTELIDPTDNQTPMILLTYQYQMRAEVVS